MTVATSSVTAEALVVVVVLAEEADQAALEAGATPTTLEERRTATPPVVTTDVAPADPTLLINEEDAILVAMHPPEIEEAHVTKEAVLPLAVEAVAQAPRTTPELVTDLPQTTARASAPIAPTVPRRARRVLQDASSEDQDQEISRQEETAHQRPRAPLKTRR